MAVWQATLLVVDEALLLQVAQDVLQQAKLDDSESTPENGGSLVTFILSFWLSGKLISELLPSSCGPAGLVNKATDSSRLQVARRPSYGRWSRLLPAS